MTAPAVQVVVDILARKFGALRMEDVARKIVEAIAPAAPIVDDFIGDTPIYLDQATHDGRRRQLDELLRFQNALIEACPPPDELTSDQLTLWFVEKLRAAKGDVLPCDVAVAPATIFRAGVSMRFLLDEIEQRRKDIYDEPITDSVLSLIREEKEEPSGFTEAQIDAAARAVCASEYLITDDAKKHLEYWEPLTDEDKNNYRDVGLMCLIAARKAREV